MIKNQSLLKQRLKTTVICLVLLTGLAPASMAQPLSLEECVHVALEKNQGIANGKLDAQATAYKVKEVRSALLPTVDINGQYLYYFAVPEQYVPASTFGGPEGEWARGVFAVPQNTSANVQLSQTLYNHQVMIGLKAATAARSASTIQLTMSQEEVVYNVSATYYNIQVAQDYLASLDSNLVNLEKTVKRNEALKNNDLMPGSSYKRLLINLQNLRNARQNQQLALDKNTGLLKYLLHKPLAEPLEVMPFDYNSVIENLVPGNVNNRSDIRLQQETIKLAELDKKSTVAGYYPTLRGNMFYGYAGYNGTFAPTEQINNDWINSSYFSLSLNIPVFDGFNKHYKIKQKQVSLQKNINTLSMMRLNAEKEIQDANSNLVSIKNLLANSKRSLDLAQELFKNATIEYGNGLISSTDYLAAQDDLTDARNNYSTALINLKIAELQFKKANGELVRGNQ